MEYSIKPKSLGERRIIHYPQKRIIGLYVKDMEQKRLYKSSTNRVLCGVCGGIGEYFNIDPTIIRLIFVLFVFGVGSGLLAYIVAAIIMPEQKY